MAGSNYYSTSDYSPPTTSSSLGFESPTPSIEPRHSYGKEPTGHTPNKKKAKKNLCLSPITKEKIDDIHHDQQNIINLQREMYYEQRINSRKLSLLESIAIKFCGKDIPRECIVEPIPYSQPTSSGWNPWHQSPQRPHVSPNSWEKQNYWSPLKPLIEDTKIEPYELKSPTTPK